MIKASDDWGIIDRISEILQDGQRDPETPASPGDIDDWDLTTATDEAGYEITGARFPEIAMLEAYARNGYLDNDQIWEEIGEAIKRAAAARIKEIWEEYLEEEDGPEE